MDTETAGNDHGPKTNCGYCLRGEHNNCQALIATVEKIIIGSHRLTKIYSISVLPRLDIY